MTRRRWIPWGLLLLASFVAASQILGLPGWPQNHEGVGPFQRVETMRRALAGGNLLPLWTPLAENGYGSPFPFFYPRLFNTLAGAVALATGPLAAVKILIPLFLFAGALGMRRALLAMGLGEFHAACGALLLVFSNYAYTDWVVRGAFAEFAAFMLVPWLTLAALGVARARPRAGWALGAILSLLFFAHSMIFVFAFALVGVAALAALVFSRDVRRTALNLAAAAFVVVPVTGPFLLGQWLFGKDLELDRFRAGMFSVFRNFVPLGEYLYDGAGGWVSGRSGYSVEIGRGFNTLALVAFAAVAVSLIRKGDRTRDRVREMLPAWFLVVGSAACYLFLQTPLSAPLYRLVPSLQFIEFPWRLLTYATAASVSILCLSLDGLEAGFPRPLVRRGLRAALVLAVLFQVFYGVGRPPPRLLGTREIEAGLTTERLAAQGGFSGTFLPRGIARPPAPRPFLEAAGCVVVSASPAAALSGIADAAELRIVVDASPDGTLVINQFANPFLAVTAGDGGRVGTTAWGAILVTPPAGRSEIVVRRRGLLAALRERLFGS